MSGMEREELGKYFDRPYYVVDLLPEQAGADRAGRYFAVEKYYLTLPLFRRTSQMAFGLSE